MDNLLVESYKGRIVNTLDSVMVYRNLNANKLSVMIKGVVHAHTSIIWLKNAEFVIRASGREKVLKEQRKNVHAFVKGTAMMSKIHIESNVERVYDNLENLGYIRVYYNPYKVESFVKFDSLEPVHRAEEAIVVMDRIYIKNKY